MDQIINEDHVNRNGIGCIIQIPNLNITKLTILFNKLVFLGKEI